MDVSDDPQSSQLDDASKLFEERLQEQTFMIQGIPGFVTPTHRGKCSTCATYAIHVIVTARSLMVEILSHQIEVALWTVWPKVLTRIEDEAIDKACGKLSWYCDRYEESTKSLKALEEKLFSERDRRRKAEARLSELESELNNLKKEVKSLGKRKASPETRTWHEWESDSDSASVEQLLSKNSRKRWRRKQAAPELPTGGMITPPNKPPMDVGPGHILPLVGYTKFGEEGPDLPLPKGIVEPIPMGLTLPPASVTGKLPCLLGKSKPGQRSWQISDPEFQKALQVARAVRPTDRMGKQHAIITRMTKHEKQQTCAKSTPPFTIL